MKLNPESLRFESPADKVPRFLLAFFLDIVEEGSTFEELPTHLTLFPPLFAEYNDSYGEELKKLLNPLAPFWIAVGGQDNFGPNHDILVHRIEESSELRELHEKIGGVVSRIAHDSTFMRPYNPHITLKGDSFGVHEGLKIWIGGLSIIERKLGEPWRIVRKIGLRGLGGVLDENR